MTHDKNANIKVGLLTIPFFSATYSAKLYRALGTGCGAFLCRQIRHLLDIGSAKKVDKNITIR